MRETIRLHGHEVSFLREGSGPALVLVHGVTSGSATWERAISLLARDHTVIAPDLLGHGESAKPRGDYSLGAFAAGVRDLLAALDIETATVVGHSLGGGVAMQLAYQFPERVERLVLVSSGGLGREVSFVLRAASLPGSELVLPLVTARWIAAAGGFVGGVLDRIGLELGADLEGMSRGYASLSDAARAARVRADACARSSTPGASASAPRDRLYLAAGMPTLIVWGARDRIIPVRHGAAAHDAMPGSRLEILERGGHFPHNDDAAVVLRRPVGVHRRDRAARRTSRTACASCCWRGRRETRAGGARPRCWRSRRRPPRRRRCRSATTGAGSPTRQGRVVNLHGINMVYKRPPYAPDAAGFGDDDAAFLASRGLQRRPRRGDLQGGRARARRLRRRLPRPHPRDGRHARGARDRRRSWTSTRTCTTSASRARAGPTGR